jgi:hypothetical protein
MDAGFAIIALSSRATSFTWFVSPVRDASIGYFGFQIK